MSTMLTSSIPTQNFSTHITNLNFSRIIFIHTYHHLSKATPTSNSFSKNIIFLLGFSLQFILRQHDQIIIRIQCISFILWWYQFHTKILFGIPLIFFQPDSDTYLISLMGNSNHIRKCHLHREFFKIKLCRLYIYFTSFFAEEIVIHTFYARLFA